MSDREEISLKEAQDSYGVEINFGRMKANYERRFRVASSNDHSAYIRTEASDIGGWQFSHFHLQVVETYIVQNGWMVVAELRDGEPVFFKFGEGEIYSTPISIVHNVYLPGGSVIHTVKHGQGVKNDWIGAAKSDDAGSLDAATRTLGEIEFLTRVKPYASAPAPLQAISSGSRDRYSVDYRHFDTLLWQVPSWATAAFALTLSAIDKNLVFKAHLADSSDRAAWTLNSDAAMAAGPYMIVSFALLVFAVACWRFHKRQVSLRGQSPYQAARSLSAKRNVSGNPGRFRRAFVGRMLSSASSWSLLLVLVQTGAVFFVAVVTAGCPVLLAAALSTAGCLALHTFMTIDIWFGTPLDAEQGS